MKRIAALLFILYSNVALAHGPDNTAGYWIMAKNYYATDPVTGIKTNCCNEDDCKSVDPASLKVTPVGYIMPDGELIPHDKVRPSEAEANGQKLFIRCKFPNQPTRCFFAPSGGM